MMPSTAPVTCPGCGSAKVTKTGHPDHLGLDTFRCEECGAQFTVQAPKE
jgi:transposase-like protein